MSLKDFILLIEDNDRDIELTRRNLVKGNIKKEVKVIKDGKDAIYFLFVQEKEPLPKTILLDLNLPFVSGLKILKRIREDERTKDIIVIVLTEIEKDITASYELGANGYLSKNTDAGKMAKIIKNLENI